MPSPTRNRLAISMRFSKRLDRIPKWRGELRSPRARLRAEYSAYLALSVCRGRSFGKENAADGKLGLLGRAWSFYVEFSSTLRAAAPSAGYLARHRITRRLHTGGVEFNFRA